MGAACRIRTGLVILTTDVRSLDTLRRQVTLSMPVSRVSEVKLKVGTVVRENGPNGPVYHVVASVEPEHARSFLMFGSTAPVVPKWRMKFRAASDDEKILADVMQT